MLRNKVVFSFIVFVFSLVFILGFFSQGLSEVAYAEEMPFAKSNNYLLDTVLVTLKPDANNRQKVYTASDFNHINCILVEDLTAKTNDKIDTLVGKIIEGETLSAEELKFVKSTSSFKRILKLKLATNSKDSLIEAISQLKKRNDVLYADPDYHIEQKSMQPNDPSYTTNPTSGDQWYINKISLPQAWDITTGSSSTRVCIIDTKINNNHEEFSDRQEGGYVIRSNFSVAYHRECLVTYSGGEQSYTWTGGYGSLVYGRHGTVVAGIIGANTNNGIGMAGVCWSVDMVSYAYEEDNDSPTSSAIADAIELANDASIPIINLSGGWYVSDSRYKEPSVEPNIGDANYTNTLKAAIDNYYGLLVCAAGNEGLDNDGSNPLYPASYNCDNIISVGASDKSDNIVVLGPEDGSNYGEETVDLFAPGADMMGPNYVNDDDEYIVGLNGTSYAAPLVTGVAALLLSKYPCLSATEIKDAILDNVDEIASLDGKCITGGRLNAFAALSNCEPSHNSVLTIVSSTASTHTGYCICGELVTRGHDYIYSNITSANHYQECVDCGYSGTFIHRMNVRDTGSVTEHIKECDCGYSITEAHTWVSTALGYRCSVCKKVTTFIPGIHPMLSPRGLLLLQAANLQHGQVALIEGLPIIYFNGEYYLLSDSTTQVPYPIPPALQTE